LDASERINVNGFMLGSPHFFISGYHSDGWLLFCASSISAKPVRDIR
jgi:hypothetical protein